MPEYSGSGLRAHNLYKRLKKKYSGINVTVFCGSETENTNGEYTYDGFTVNRIACKPYPVLHSNSLLRRFQISKNFYSENVSTRNLLDKLASKPDLVHIFGQNYVTATVLDYARKNNIPSLIELCNEMEKPYHYIPFPNKLWVSSKLPQNYRFVCISERLKQVCLKNNIPSEKIWCRPNPVDEKRFYPARDEQEKIELRRKLTKFSAGDKLLMYIAKYISRKNHAFLIDVLKLLPGEYKLFLGGPLVESGPNRAQNLNLYENILARVKNEGLEDRIEVKCGFYDNIDEYYRMADAFLFPTREEGLGTPMLESIASGVPVVANIIPGITDIWIKNNKNGFLSDLEARKFAEKIQAAVRIPQSQMKSEAEKLVDKAGTRAIDEQYYSLICGLANS